MGQVNVTIGGRSYRLACRDGEEPHLTSLAEHLSRRADELSEALGQMSEPRLLLMAGIMVTDELFDARRSAGEDDTDAQLAELADRIEAVARSLEQERKSP